MAQMILFLDLGIENREDYFDSVLCVLCALTSFTCIS